MQYANARPAIEWAIGMLTNERAALGQSTNGFTSPCLWLESTTAFSGLLPSFYFHRPCLRNRTSQVNQTRPVLLCHFTNNNVFKRKSVQWGESSLRFLPNRPEFRQEHGAVLHKTFLEPNVIGNISVMETKQVAWLWNINGGSEFDVARCLVRGIINELISNSRGIYS